MESITASDWDICAEPAPLLLRTGVAQFNAGIYWECHETLETLWRSEPRAVRNLYQGILLVGVACLHFRAGNLVGARKVLLRAHRHLLQLPDVCQGVDVVALRGVWLRLRGEFWGEPAIENWIAPAIKGEVCCPAQEPTP
jgi:uncharacterized protein